MVDRHTCRQAPIPGVGEGVWEGCREGGRERDFKIVLQMWLLPAKPEDLNAILEPHDGRRETTLPSYSQTPARTWRSVLIILLIVRKS